MTFAHANRKLKIATFDFRKSVSAKGQFDRVDSLHFRTSKVKACIRKVCIKSEIFDRFQISISIGKNEINVGLKMYLWARLSNEISGISDFSSLVYKFHERFSPLDFG